MVLLMVGGRTGTKEWREGELMFLMRREPAFLVWGDMSWVDQGGQRGKAYNRPFNAGQNSMDLKQETVWDLRFTVGAEMQGGG